MRYFILILALCLQASFLQSQKTQLDNQPQELGKISWYRSYDEALVASKELDKAVFMLFQEIPGCATCRNFADDVLSQPLLVEIIENEFIPLAIYNNRKGADAHILAKYNEPSWNNPVIRIIDHKGENIVSRISNQYTADVIMHQVVTALQLSNEDIPHYVTLFEKELLKESENVESAYFSMYCFWSGEAFFGSQEGILKTEPGFMNGKEVVKIWYDKLSVKLDQLIKKAQKEKIEYENTVSLFKPDKDPQYYLKKSIYSCLPLTDMQKTKINAALANNENPEIWLSPSQLSFLQNIEAKDRTKWPEKLYHLSIYKSWPIMKARL
jgi:hypothetical protein